MYLLANPRREMHTVLLKKREKGKICSDVRTEACGVDWFRIIISGVFTPGEDIKQNTRGRDWERSGKFSEFTSKQLINEVSV